MYRLIILAGLIWLMPGCRQEARQAELILINGNIITMDSEMPNATTVAVGDPYILAVGNEKDVESFRSEQTKVVDLEGKTVIPGFIEGHAHFLGLGFARMKLDLNDTRSWQEIVALVREKAAETSPGEWIEGRGWHQEKWDAKPAVLVEGYPVHRMLSDAAPDNPVILTHASGHAVIVNQKALEASGITTATPDPVGGRIIRDKKGKPTGVLLENAEELIVMGGSSDISARKRKAAGLAIRECLSYGITSFQDAGSSFSDVDLYRRMIKDNQFKIRLWAMLSESNDSLQERGKQYRIIGEGPNLLTVRAIKRYMDGALGSRGAWLLEPYNDMPSTSGLNTIDLDYFKETCRFAIENEYQVCTHAIGDRANRETLDIYEEIFHEHHDKVGARWRIEHAQHLSPADISRFAELGVIAAMQTVHCTSDGPWVPQRIGDRRAKEGAYIWKSLIRSNAIVSNGTDAPVESVNPFANFYAAVTRKMKNGELFYPQQAMSRYEALKSMTYAAAYAAFEEDIKGTIAPGKLADMAVLSADIMTVPADEIPKIHVVQTFLGGEVVYPEP